MSFLSRVGWRGEDEELPQLQSFLFSLLWSCFFPYLFGWVFSQLGHIGLSAAQLAGLGRWLMSEASSRDCPFQQTQIFSHHQQQNTRTSALRASHVGGRWEHFWSAVFTVLKQRSASSCSAMTPLTGAWWALRDFEDPHTWQKMIEMMWDLERFRSVEDKRAGTEDKKGWHSQHTVPGVLHGRLNVFLCVTFSYKIILRWSGATKQNLSMGTHCHLMEARCVTLH